MVSVDDHENGTSLGITNAGTTETNIFLPNGRRSTGEVIRPEADQISYVDGEPTLLETPVPGVSMSIHVDAVGALTQQDRLTAYDPVDWTFNGPSTNSDYAPIYELATVPQYLGSGEPTGDDPGGVLAGVHVATSHPRVNFDITFPDNAEAGNGPCACRGNEAEVPSAYAKQNTSTGIVEDGNAGNGMDYPLGIMFGAGQPSPFPVFTGGGGGLGGYAADDVNEAGLAEAECEGWALRSWGFEKVGGDIEGGLAKVESKLFGGPASPPPAPVPDPSIGGALGPTGGEIPVHVGPGQSSAGGSKETRALGREADDVLGRIRKFGQDQEAQIAKLNKQIDQLHAMAAKLREWARKRHAERAKRDAEARAKGLITLDDLERHTKPKTAGDGGNGKPPTPPKTSAGFPGDNHEHHLWPNFRGSPDQDIILRWYKRLGIKRNQHCVTLGEDMHIHKIHDPNANWIDEVRDYILKHPRATRTEADRFMEQLMHDYGIDDLPVHSYGQKP